MYTEQVHDALKFLDYAPLLFISAAEGQHISARRLHKLGLVDDLIPEPLGGAHHDHAAMAQTLKTTLLTTLEDLRQLKPDELLERRYQKFRNIGVFSRAEAPVDVAVSAD